MVYLQTRSAGFMQKALGAGNLQETGCGQCAMSLHKYTTIHAASKTPLVGKTPHTLS